jgi:predicted dehydrogenase
MQKVYSAAVIGAGAGGNLSMAGLAASSRLNLVAVADMSDDALQAAKARYPGIQTFSTYQALFEACPTDVMCISTWVPSHLEITQAALQLPLKGILVEKPLAENSRDGHTLLEAVRTRKLPMAVPHNLIVLPHVNQLMNRVHGGEIGDLKLIEIECSGWDIINAGIHWLNFVVVLTGNEPVEWVMAALDQSTRTYRDGMQVETLAVTTIQTRSGLRIVMNTGDYVKIAEPGKVAIFRLVGTLGIIEFYAWESRYCIVNAEFPMGKLIEVETGPRTGHQIHLENLADHMDKGVADHSIPESSLAALELCQAAYLSARHQCKVTVPLARFAPSRANDWEPGKPYSGSGGGRDGRKLPAVES